MHVLYGDQAAGLRLWARQIALTPDSIQTRFPQKSDDQNCLVHCPFLWNTTGLCNSKLWKAKDSSPGNIGPAASGCHCIVIHNEWLYGGGLFFSALPWVGADTPASPLRLVGVSFAEEERRYIEQDRRLDCGFRPWSNENERWGFSPLKVPGPCHVRRAHTCLHLCALLPLCTVKIQDSCCSCWRTMLLQNELHVICDPSMATLIGQKGTRTERWDSLPLIPWKS